jgi:hypothetical protein
MRIGHPALIGTSMAMDCLCRNNVLAPLIPSLRRFETEQTSRPFQALRQFV